MTLLCLSVSTLTSTSTHVQFPLCHCPVPWDPSHHFFVCFVWSSRGQRIDFVYVGMVFWNLTGWSCLVTVCHSPIRCWTETKHGTLYHMLENHSVILILCIKTDLNILAPKCWHKKSLIYAFPMLFAEENDFFCCYKSLLITELTKKATKGQPYWDILPYWLFDCMNLVALFIWTEIAPMSSSEVIRSKYLSQISVFVFVLTEMLTHMNSLIQRLLFIHHIHNHI